MTGVHIKKNIFFSIRLKLRRSHCFILEFHCLEYNTFPKWKKPGKRKWGKVQRRDRKKGKQKAKNIDRWILKMCIENKRNSVSEKDISTMVFQ